MSQEYGPRQPTPPPTDRRSPTRHVVTATVTIAEAYRLGVIDRSVAADALDLLETTCDDARIDADDILASLVDLDPGALVPVRLRVKQLLVGLRREAKEADASAPIPEKDGRDARRYRDLHRLGHGGMGVVYSAYDPVLDRRVALKFMRVDSSGGSGPNLPTAPLDINPGISEGATARQYEETTRRFLREARITGQMQHPGVLPIYEIGCTELGLPYYAMALLSGRLTLKDAILPPGRGTMEQRLRLLDLFLRICDTVAYAHARDIVHRDLKPQNIGLENPTTAYVLDWGLGKRSGESPERVRQDDSPRSEGDVDDPAGSHRDPRLHGA